LVDGDDAWHADLDGTGWLGHVATVLQLTARVLRDVQEREKNGDAALAAGHLAVLLRGDADGDADAVIASLVQLCLDPFARTTAGVLGAMSILTKFGCVLCANANAAYIGLAAVIEKEWVRMGFAFVDRGGFLSNTVLC
jgi:hypothetical protein